MRPLAVLAAALLAAGCAPHAPATSSAQGAPLEGSWALEPGPVSDGDSSTLSITRAPEGYRGTWVRQGDHPVVTLGQIRAEGDGLALTAQMGAGPALLRMRPAAGQAWEGEWARGDQHLAFRALRTSRVAPPELRATFALAPFAPGTLSRPDSGESFASPSADGSEIVFTRHRADWSRHRIMYARLTPAGWSEPVVVPFSGEWNDREPKLSPDGRRLVFSSNRPLQPGGAARRDLDLWMVDRLASGAWGEPRHLDAPLSSDAHDFSPVLAADGTLYFVSTRAGTPPRNHQVWRARRVDGAWQAPELLPPEINTGLETNVFVSPDQRLLLLSRDGAPDGLGGDDLYLSERRGAGWSVARHLGPPVSSFEYDYGPALSGDGRWLYFTSHRRGNGDLYRVDARSVGIPSR